MSRPLLTGPQPLRSAQATGWTELPYSQAIADSLAIAAEENANVNLVKGWWLNFSFGMATIAVVAFVLLGVTGGQPMSQGQGGEQPPQPTASPVTGQPVPPSPSPTTETPVTLEQPLGGPTDHVFVHPQLGVAELREGWDDSKAAPPPAPLREIGHE